MGRSDKWFDARWKRFMRHWEKDKECPCEDCVWGRAHIAAAQARLKEPPKGG